MTGPYKIVGQWVHGPDYSMIAPSLEEAGRLHAALNAAYHAGSASKTGGEPDYLRMVIQDVLSHPGIPASVRHRLNDAINPSEAEKYAMAERGQAHQRTYTNRHRPEAP